MTDPMSGELFSIETFDGKVLVFDGDVRFQTFGFLGAPPTTFQTRRGYKQHGATEVEYRIEERRLSFQLWHAAQVDRDAYWDMRYRLHEFLRPNRGGALQVTILMPDDSRRAIICRADPGLQFPPEGAERNHWSVEEELGFIAFDPFWFDATGTSLVLSSTTDMHLVFPITFPIQFGASGLQFGTGTLTYDGTWETFPTITLTGPYNSAVIEHLTLDIIIYLAVGIGVGEQRIITLTPGAQSIVDANGVSRFSDLGPGTNLVDFRLVPAPEVLNGEQQIQISLNGGVAGQSGAQIEYRSRFFAL